MTCLLHNIKWENDPSKPSKFCLTKHLHFFFFASEHLFYLYLCCKTALAATQWIPTLKNYCTHLPTPSIPMSVAFHSLTEKRSALFFSCCIYTCKFKNTLFFPHYFNTFKWSIQDHLWNWMQYSYFPICILWRNDCKHFCSPWLYLGLPSTI